MILIQNPFYERKICIMNPLFPKLLGSSVFHGSLVMSFFVYDPCVYLIEKFVALLQTLQFILANFVICKLDTNSRHCLALRPSY